MAQIGTFNFLFLPFFEWFTIVYMDDTLIFLEVFFKFFYNLQPAPVYNKCLP